MAFLAPLIPEILAGASVLVSGTTAIVLKALYKSQHDRLLKELNKVNKARKEAEASLRAEKKQRQDDERLQQMRQECEELRQRSDTLQKQLIEVIEQMRRDQLESREQLKREMASLIEEQTASDKEQKLKDITEIYLNYCKMYANHPEKLTTKTIKFQEQFQEQLTIVKNAMKNDASFLTRFKTWVTAVMLNVKMLEFLEYRGEVDPTVVQETRQRHRREVNYLVSNFEASNALPSNMGEIRAIVDSIIPHLRRGDECASRNLLESAPPHQAIQEPFFMIEGIISPLSTLGALALEEVPTVPVQRERPHVQALQQPEHDDQLEPNDDARREKCNDISRSLQEFILAD